MCRGPSISILCFNLFFEKFLNHQVRINKRVECVDYHPTPSGLVTLNLKDPPSHIYSQYLFQLFVKPVYYITVGEKFKNMVFRLLENAFACQKNEGIYSHSPLGKTLPEVLILTPRQMEITHPPEIDGVRKLWKPSSKCMLLKVRLFKTYYPRIFFFSVTTVIFCQLVYSFKTIFCYYLLPS